MFLLLLMIIFLYAEYIANECVERQKDVQGLLENPVSTIKVPSLLFLEHEYLKR